MSAFRSLVLGESKPGDLPRAVIELALANRKLKGANTSDLLREEPADPRVVLTPGDRKLVRRVSYVIPRVAMRVPWRADCLVQALAARNWLAAHGLASTIRLGARKGADSSSLEAHAWLTIGDVVVTGGDISRFREFEPA